ncbi:hypothetical protein BpHYR1_005730 [Brachionus plicatilis]|uniref:RNA-directed DNA polymerase from mobile element jockey-like n=1 Tax=Brachionus plicatilis TaxID=10195 RepID=A0A3M7S1P0_BRAPC|nr:hypothetical protein BpHYR1_005730 [Brachionus plicatilis]
MSNKNLKPSDKIFFLGIRFDHSLSFKNQLQRIQNFAIKLKYQENTQNIHRLAGIKILNDRFRKLNGNYFNTLIQNKNPLINVLISEFKLFKRG